MHNRKRLLWAGFFAMMVEGGGVLGDWSAQFGFTKTELGAITGGVQGPAEF